MSVPLYSCSAFTFLPPPVWLIKHSSVSSTINLSGSITHMDQLQVLVPTGLLLLLLFFVFALYALLLYTSLYHHSLNFSLSSTALIFPTSSPFSIPSSSPYTSQLTPVTEATNWKNYFFLLFGYVFTVFAKTGISFLKSSMTLLLKKCKQVSDTYTHSLNIVITNCRANPVWAGPRPK